MQVINAKVTSALVNGTRLYGYTFHTKTGSTKGSDWVFNTEVIAYQALVAHLETIIDNQN